MARSAVTGNRGILRWLSRWRSAIPREGSAYKSDAAAPVKIGQRDMDMTGSLQRALQFHRNGAFAEALELYQAILTREPGHFDARFLAATVAMQDRQYALALEHLEVASRSDPPNGDVLAAMGDAFVALHRYPEAIASYERTLALEPLRVDVLANVALPLHKLGRHVDSLAKLDLALQAVPDNVDALLRRGIVLAALERPQEALASFDRVIAQDGRNAEALNNRGIVLSTLGRTREALASYDLAVQVHSQYPDAHSNRGLALCEVHRYAEAEQSYAVALSIDPAYANAHYNRGLCRLLHGDFEQGWPLYEWRWKIEQFQPFVKQYPQPQWRGTESLAGKSILLHAEQGLGDTLQFSRYATLVARLGARVYLEAPSSLQTLLSSLDGVLAVSATHESAATLDFHCPLLSLPLAFRTTLDSIPGATPYLHADGARVRQWQNRLGHHRKFRVGLVWSGNPGHRNDRNRSIPLALFAPLLALDANFISLQKGVRDADRVHLDLAERVTQFGDTLEDFSDTAALVDCLDLVITVDTAVAHLAGAMGKPVWILLPHNPDWRWMLERSDTPWYPTARLFRQGAAGDWQGVIEALTAVLREVAG